MRRIMTAMFASVMVGIPAIAGEVTVTKCEYWLDHDFDSRIELPVSSDGEFHQSFDMSGHAAGLHSIGLRFCDSRGLWSVPVLRHFIKVHAEQPINSVLTGLTYWLDHDIDHPVSVGCPGGVVEMPLDVASMRPGLHALTYMASESNGLYSPAVTRYFIVPHAAPEEGGPIVGYDYWFNHGRPAFVPVSATDMMELKDVTIEAVGVQPMSIPDDYTFDVASLTVTCPQSDVFFGMQPVNKSGGRSGAVLSDIVKMDLTVTPVFQTAVVGEAVRFVPPCGGVMSGVRMDAGADDKFVVGVKGGDVHADFYDGDGSRLSTEVTKDGDVRSYVFTAPCGPEVYMLLHSARDAQDEIEVTVAERAMSSVDAVALGAVRVSSVPGAIRIDSPAWLQVTVYDVAGSAVVSCQAGIGKTLLPMMPGLYVVTLSDGTVARVAVR